jgi:molecular chaperone DnaJ
LQSEGEIGPNGGPAGDLYVEIVVGSHPVFERRGEELHCMLTIPMTSAALGTSVELETLDGPEKLIIAAGTHSGESLIVKGKGVGRLRGSGRGDLFVHMNIATPTDLDAQQEALLRQLAELRQEQSDHRLGNQSEGSGGLFSRLKEAFNSR